jgi:hypothetical protein
MIAISQATAQSQKYNQANNEINFNHDISGQWALESDFGQSWTSEPGKAPVLS